MEIKFGKPWKKTKETFKELQILANPIRYDICKELKNGDSYASRIADRLNIDPKLAAYHLNSLVRNGFAEAYIKIKEQSERGPIAVKNYRLTEKAIGLIEKLERVLT